jgi:predicted aspartyl protease
MARIHLRVYIAPGRAEVFVKFRQPDGNPFRQVATVDTGAATSLMPIQILPKLDARIIRDGITVQQAGIAHHVFTVTVAIVKMSLEDETGNQTSEIEAPFWFADTEQALIGFQGILDRAVLHIDMPQRDGWIEIPESK